MASVVYFPNSLCPADRQHYVVDSPTRFCDWLDDSGFGEVFEQQPVYVLLNGQEFLEQDFGRELGEDDLLTLCVLPEWAAVGAFFAFLVEYWAVIQFVLVVALVLTQEEPDIPDGAEQKEGSPTYSINSRGNRARLGQPKPVLYGTFRVFPDLAAIPYSDFEAGREQHLYQLFEISQGIVDVDVNSIRFAETRLADFDDAQLEVIPPGQRSTLFPSAVTIIEEVQNITIANATVGPYTLSAATQKAVRVAWDVVAPRGIYLSDRKSGDLRTYTIEVAFDLREIDDAGAPLGAWVEHRRHAFSNNNRDPIRVTVQAVVTAGRYETRVRRLTPTQDSLYISDDLVLSQVKAFLEDDTGITTTTRIAIKIRASEQIGNRALSQMSLVASRRIETWDPIGGWDAPSVTSNPAWVFADICRSSYGGNRADSHIDLPTLHALAAQFDSEGVQFNGVFDTAGTVWDALTRVAQVGRARPVDRAGVYTMVRDSFATQPVMMFTQRNIVRDSFSITQTGVLEETADAVKVLFWDKDQDYRQVPVLCALPGSPAANPREVRFFGVTDADQAFKLGMGLAAENQFRRETITFDAGFDGVIPFFGDVIAISHYLVGREKFTQVSGDVRSFDGNNVLVLSERVDHIVNPFIVIKNLDGSPTGPYQCTVLDAQRISIDEVFDSSGLQFEHGYNRPQFMLGEGVEYFATAKVRSIEPLEDNRYRINAFVDDPRVYQAADGLQIPPIDQLPGPNQVVPVISKLVASLSGTVDQPQVILTWDATNSDYFVVEYSPDLGNTWIAFAQKPVQTQFIDFPEPGVIHYRVAGVNILRGSFANVVIDTNDVEFAAPPPVSNLALREAFTGPVLKIQWDSFTLRHRVRFSDAGVEKYTEIVDGEEYDLHFAVAEEFGLGRGFDVEVFAVGPNGKQSTSSPLLSVFNPPPAQLNNLAIDVLGVVAIVNYDFPQDSDLAGISIWMSGSDGFTPSDATLVVDRSANPVEQIPLMVDVPLYVRVAAVDVWSRVAGELNISGQFTAIGTDFELVDDIIEARHIINGAVEEAKIAANAVTAQKLADNAVNAQKLANDAVTAAKIAANAVGSTKIQADAITAIHIAAQAIEAAAIAVDAINATHLSADAVTADAIAANAINAIHVAANAISAAAIQANAISSDKIVADAILTLHIAANQVIAAHIAAGQINANHINVSTLSAISANLGTVTSGLFRTTEINAGSRVEIDSVGSYPFWIGSGGLKNETFAQVFYDRTTQRWVHFDIVSGYRVEIQPNSSIPFYIGSGTKSLANARFCMESNGTINVRGIRVYHDNGSLLLSSGTGFQGLGQFATLNQITSLNISTYIQGAAIGGAYIGSLAVDTLHIQNNAVTIPVTAFTSGFVNINVTYTTIQSAAINSLGSPVIIWASTFLTYGGNDNSPEMSIRVLRDGITIWERQNHIISSSDSISFQFIDIASSGPHTYSLQFQNVSSDGQAVVRSHNPTITLLAAKK